MHPDISGKVSWFNSYLNGSSFNVSWKGYTSSCHPLPTQVPHGSVLGHLLFTMYYTSLGPIINSYGLLYHCYVDDTHFYMPFSPDDPTVSGQICASLTSSPVHFLDSYILPDIEPRLKCTLIQTQLTCIGKVKHWCWGTAHQGNNRIVCM